MPDSKNDKLLTEIRENYTYFSEVWEPIRKEAKIDMRYVSGDPWESAERDFRVKHDRPVMTWDELSPYINDLINELRQNKRAIRINPKGAGATDRTAELRENRIRDIQYNSRAQSAFITAAQGAVERSYGYFGINARLKACNLTDEQVKELAESDPGKLFEQELYIYRIPNPDSVMFNPNYKEQDCSDSTECFVQDIISRNQFKRDWPNARFGDFSEDYIDEAPGWSIGQKEVRVARYWKVIVRKRKLYLLTGMDDPNDYIAMYEDELAPNEDGVKKWLGDDKNKKRIKRDRSVDTRTVKQYTTNGLEILDESAPIPIPWIPIVPVFGKEMWVDADGSGAKRKLISLVRMARDPFMFYCYLRSQEAEEFGQTPRAPLKGYVGQFETDKEAIETLNKIPRSYVQFDAVTDASGNLLPLPTSGQFVPNAQAYEIAAEAARRAIMTAMGGANLPTAAQRRNEKSGVALKEIDEQEDKGTFHFIDNFDFALEHGGRILDAWLPYVEDTKRDVSIREADETHRTIRINDPDFEETDENGQPLKVHYDMKTGDHGVTVSVGPNTDSQREEASEFVDTIIPQIEAIAQVLPPGSVAKVLSLAIKLKQLGPIGDEIADIINPPADKVQQQQALQQAQQTAQQQQQVIVEMQKELEKLRLEKAGKVIDNQFKMQIEGMKAQNDQQLAQLDRDIQVLKALLASKQNISDQEYETFRTVWQENHGAAHEAGMQAKEHEHAHTIADKTAANAQQSQQADQSHDLTMAAQQPEPAQPTQ